MSNRLPQKVLELSEDPDERVMYHEWRTTKAITINPIMGMDSAFSDQRASIRQTPPSKILEDCLRSLRDPDIEGFMKSGGSNWDVVHEARDFALASIKEAKSNHKLRGNSIVRRVARHSSTAIATLEPLLDIIPDQMGLSVLRGGLCAIFKFLEKQRTNRDKIFEAFENVPTLLIEAQETYRLCSSESKIRDQVSHLYLTLLEELPKLIDLLLHDHKQKLPTRLLKYLPESEGNNIDESLQRVSSASQKLSSALEYFQLKTAISTNRNTADTLSQTQAIRSTLHDARYHLQEQNSLSKIRETQLEAIQQNLIGVDTSMDELKNMFLSASKTVAESNENFVRRLIGDVQGGIFHHVLENIVSREIMKFTRHLSNESFTRPPAFVVTSEMLLRALNVPYLSPSSDLERVFDQSKLIKPEHLGRARWLLTDFGFQNWLAPQQSNYLLIDGHCADFGINKISPLSVFVASMGASLTQTTEAVPLTFFCGEHLADSDILYGPWGIVRSLILQLLLQFPSRPELNLEFMDQDMFERVWNSDMKALCYLFGHLVQRVKHPTTIYCLVDNISELEGSVHGWSDELHILIDELISIAEDERSTAIFKLLMTCGHRSIGAVELFPIHKHIQLQTGNSHHSIMGASGLGDDFQRLISSSPAVEHDWEYASRIQEGREQEREQEGW